MYTSISGLLGAAKSRTSRRLYARGAVVSPTVFWKSFVPWTLDAVVDAIKAEGGGSWVECFARRYLAFDRIDWLVASRR
jgi:hypothetical protein